MAKLLNKETAVVELTKDDVKIIHKALYAEHTSASAVLYDFFSDVFPEEEE